MVDISGLRKADVLAALYDGSVNHMGLFGWRRVLDLTGDEFDAGPYDRDNGAGAAERAIAPLRRKAA